MSTWDGGPAFPVPIDDEQGMTLRDWFAGQALAGLCVNFSESRRPEACAERAYAIADAMLDAMLKAPRAQR